MKKYFLVNLLHPSFSVCSGQSGSLCEKAKYQDVVYLKSKDISDKPDFWEKSGFLHNGKFSAEHVTCLTKHEVKNA